MTLRAWSLLGVLFPAALSAGACRNRASERNATRGPAITSASERALTPAPPAARGSLPEDPEAAAKSSAQWHEHLAHEELERRLGYDRRKLPEHRVVLKRLHDARNAYDRASSKPAVLSAERTFRALLPKLDQSFDEIDHWGVSSKVLPDYRKLADTFSDSYPNARLAALAGDARELERIGKDVDAEFASIDSWLHDAAESEDDE